MEPKKNRSHRVHKRKNRRARKPHSSSKGSICFVMAPFGGWNDRYYEEVYCPAVEAADLVPKRADDLYRPSAIVHDIWAYVRKSQVMLADVTGKNPNVFYELGLAHALGKPVVIVTRSMEDVPFDLRALRVIQYDVQDPEWSDILSATITKSLREVLAAPEEAVPPPFLSEKKVTKSASVTPTHKAILKLQQDMDLIRAEVRSRGRIPDTISGPEEAELALERYRRLGMPNQVIISRLTRRGVPRDWLEDRLRGLRRRKKTVPAAAPDEPPVAVKNPPTS